LYRSHRPQEHAQLVRDACEQQRADRAAKAARARARAAERAWLQLLRTLWRRVEMDRRMAADADDAHGLMAAALAGSGRKRTAKQALEALEEEGAARPRGAGAGAGGAPGGLEQIKRRRGSSEGQAGGGCAGEQAQGARQEGEQLQQEAAPSQPEAPLLEGLQVEEF
jgi:hypothetical protein